MKVSLVCGSTVGLCLTVRAADSVALVVVPDAASFVTVEQGGVNVQGKRDHGYRIGGEFKLPLATKEGIVRVRFYALPDGAAGSSAAAKLGVDLTKPLGTFVVRLLVLGAQDGRPSGRTFGEEQASRGSGGVRQMRSPQDRG